MAVGAADWWESALDIALMVFGVVRQQPPKSDAPASRHLPTYDTKSSSAVPFEGCQSEQGKILERSNNVKDNLPVIELGLTRDVSEIRRFANGSGI